MESARMATEPLRGADGLCAARSGALEGILLIPGRPRSRLRDEHGRLLRSGQVYLDYVRHLARRRWGQGVAYPTGQLPIRIELFYAVADAEAEAMRGAHVTWHLQNIPRADTAPTVILTLPLITLPGMGLLVTRL